MENGNIKEKYNIYVVCYFIKIDLGIDEYIYLDG